jgi:hypothetical protein
MEFYRMNERHRRGESRTRHPRHRGERLTTSRRHPGRKRKLHPNRAHKHIRGGHLVACPHRGHFGGR